MPYWQISGACAVPYARPRNEKTIIPTLNLVLTLAKQESGPKIVGVQRIQQHTEKNGLFPL